MKNRSAFGFVLIIGIVNFFADLTYEGARGIVGPFLGSLGASAAIVGFIAGFGSNALARRSLDWGRLGLWPQRGARSGGRNNRPATYRPDPFSKGRIPNWLWRIAHSSFALSGHFVRGAVLTSSPTGIRGIVGAASCDALPDAALLDLSRRGRVDRRRFRGFRVDRISFPKGAHGPDKSDSRLLRSRDGEQCPRCTAIWPLIRQIRRQYRPARVFHFCGICAFCFSRHILFRIDRDDPLGDRDERTGIAASGDVDRRNPGGKAQHGVWLV